MLKTADQPAKTPAGAALRIMPRLLVLVASALLALAMLCAVSWSQQEGQSQQLFVPWNLSRAEQLEGRQGSTACLHANQTSMSSSALAACWQHPSGQEQQQASLGPTLKTAAQLESKPAGFQQQQPQACHDTSMPTIAFIIPNQGRPTLNTTLQSLQNQTCSRAWKAIVVLDGVQLSAEHMLLDHRIGYLQVPKTGVANHGAKLRNAGIAASGEAWVAFVDDDDTVSPLYVEQLLQHQQQEPSMQTVIFRMWNSFKDRPDRAVLPPPAALTIQEGAVGISYAVQRQLFTSGGGNFSFTPGNLEDWVLLRKLLESNVRMMISPHLTYFVKALPEPELYMQRFPKVLLRQQTKPQR